MKTINRIVIRAAMALLLIFVILSTHIDRDQADAATLSATVPPMALRNITFSKPVIALKWSPDGNKLAVANLDSADITILNPQSLNIEDTFKFPTSHQVDFEVDSIVWCSTSQFIAAVLRTEHVINVWDMKNVSAKPTLSITADHKFIHATWSADCKSLAVLTFADNSSEINVWDISSKVVSRTFSQPDQTITWLSWSPNGKFVATETHTEGDPTVELQIRNPTTFEVVKIFSIDGKNGFTPSLAHYVWSPDSSRLAGCSVGNAYKMCRLWIWNIESDQLLTPFEFLVPSQNRFLLWSQNGKSLILDNNVNSFALLDVSSGQILQTQAIGSNEIDAMDINPLGNKIAVADGTGQVNLYLLQD